MSVRLPLLPGIIIDSDYNQTETKSKADLVLDLQQNAFKLPKETGPHFIKLMNAKLTNTKYNISAALGNNGIRYTLDNTAGPVAWKYITFPDGIYTTSSIFSTINSALINNSDTETDVNGQTIYPFSITPNTATSKGYVIINTNFSGFATFEVSLAYRAGPEDSVLASTFYLLYGYTAAEKETKLAASPNISTNNINIYDSQFYITCNLIQSYTAAGQKSGKILYAGNFQGVANSYYFLTSQEDIIGYIKQDYVDRIEIKIVDRNGDLINFGDNSTDSNITFSFNIY